MTINVERDFELVTLEIIGRLDTTTAPNLESVVNDLSEDIKELILIWQMLNTYPRQESEFYLAHIKK